MKRISLLFAVLFGLCSSTFAQFELTPTQEWTTVSATKDYKLSYTYTDCSIPKEGLFAEYVLLRFQNMTNETIELSWFNDTYYDGECTNCDHSKRDTKRTIILKPGEIREGKCGIGLNIGLRVHSKWTKLQGHKELEKLMVTDITIKPVIGNE